MSLLPRKVQNPQNMMELDLYLKNSLIPHQNIEIAIGKNKPWIQRVSDGFKSKQFGQFMPRIDKVAWYGSSTTLLDNPELIEQMRQFGAKMAEKNVIMKYGAGTFRNGVLNVMGSAPYGAAEAGGQVIGITTKQIKNWERPIKHPNIQLKVKLGYHKAHALFRRINELMRGTDAFVIAPGGKGSEYEHVRISNDQYMFHMKDRRPVIFLNVATKRCPNGFWRPTMKQYLNMLAEGFSSPYNTKDNVLTTNTHFVNTVDELWEKIIGAYKYGVGTKTIHLPKWQQLSNKYVIPFMNKMLFKIL